MKFTPLIISGAWLIEPEKISDDRGFFARAFCEKEFVDHNIDFHFAQSNLSHCTNVGTIRGLHYQLAPHGEAKLMRCIQGEIFDVLVDLRPESPTYLQSQGVQISAQDYQMIFIPQYCAHGYQALTDDAEVLYSVSSAYAPGAEKGIRWNDPQFAINWPLSKDVILSEKDANWPDFK